MASTTDRSDETTMVWVQPRFGRGIATAFAR